MLTVSTQILTKQGDPSHKETPERDRKRQQRRQLSQSNVSLHEREEKVGHSSRKSRSCTCDSCFFKIRACFSHWASQLLPCSSLDTPTPWEEPHLLMIRRRVVSNYILLTIVILQLRSHSFRLTGPGLNIWHSHMLAAWPWVGYLNLLSLNYIISLRRKVAVLTSRVDAVIDEGIFRV